MTKLRTASRPEKKRAVRMTMMATMTEVIQVSFQLVQVTLRASARTSRRNWTGLIGFFGEATTGAAAAGAAAGRRRTGVCTRFWSLAIGGLPTFFMARRDFRAERTDRRPLPFPGQI